ncbi:meiosis-specific coiled-coil domain-containing protein MEIOC-like [Pithys albifrons albifrons]|uniref:meiosis-specific coiled-coil domain-containing protein MEIOC-like n=1 Tax=Pithys albifrons albifrons TaxID=3385563 RepID=UPI003A5CC3A4
MDTQLFSPFLGTAPDAPPSRASSWAGGGQDFGFQTAFQEFPKKRAPINLSYSGDGPDVFGLVSSILEEPNKPEPLPDWNSLSRLFPPVWAPDLGSHGEFSGLLAKSSVENKDFPGLGGPLSCHQDQLQEPPDGQMFHRDLEDLQLMESWLSPADSALRNSSPGNSSLDNPRIHQEGFPFHSMNLNQHLGTYDHMRLNGDYGKFGSTFSPFCPQNKQKEDTNSQREYWKRGRTLKNHTQEQPECSPDLSNQSLGNSWGKTSQDNHWFSKRHENFTAAPKLQAAVHPALYFFNQTLNENKFSGETARKTQVQNGHCGFTLRDAFNNNQCKMNVGPKEFSAKVAEYDSSVKNGMESGSYSSQQGWMWLDGKRLAAGSDIPYGKQATSPQSSSGVSTMSGGSPTPQCSTNSSYYSQLPPVLPPRKDGRFSISNGFSTHLGSSDFTSENQKQLKPVGQSQQDSLTDKEGPYPEFPGNSSSYWLMQQKAGTEDPEKYHRFPKKQSQENCTKDGRRGRRNWIPPFGCPTPNHPPFNVFPKKHKQNGGSLADFINPSFLPSFPLMGDFKQNPSWPLLHHQLFSSANNLGFAPSLFSISEPVDIFHCDDFNPLSPFISDLLCGEGPAPSLAFPPSLSKFKPPRNRSGPANELHARLEECCEQWRALEKERKKTEADLARHFPGKRLSSCSNTPVCQLPANPSRVDRLIVNQSREHARVVTLVGKIERLRGAPVHRNIHTALEQHKEAIGGAQTRRKEEILHAACPQRQGVPRHSQEKGVLALAAALGGLAGATRRARTALWCAAQAAWPKNPPGAPEKQEALERALQELSPPSTSTQEESSVEQGKSKEPTRIVD